MQKLKACSVQSASVCLFFCFFKEMRHAVSKCGVKMSSEKGDFQSAADDGQ